MMTTVSFSLPIIAFDGLFNLDETVEGEEVDSDEQEYEGSRNLIKISKD